MGKVLVHRIVSKEGSIGSACVQSVLIYGTETWAMKADDLRRVWVTFRVRFGVRFRVRVIKL